MTPNNFQKHDRFRIRNAAFPRDKFLVLEVLPDAIRCEITAGTGVGSVIFFDQRNLDGYDGKIEFVDAVAA